MTLKAVSKLRSESQKKNMHLTFYFDDGFVFFFFSTCVHSIAYVYAITTAKKNVKREEKN